MKYLHVKASRAVMVICLFFVYAISVPIGATEQSQTVAIAEGSGVTIAEATENALQHAVQRVGGTLVAFDRTVSDNELKDVSASFSAGVVQDHSVLDSRRGGDGLFHVVVRALISDSALRSRLTVADSKAFDGEAFTNDLEREIARAEVERQSVENQRRGAERLLENMLYQLPAGAISVSTGSIAFENGGSELKVPVLFEGYAPFFDNLKRLLELLYSENSARNGNSFGTSSADKRSNAIPEINIPGVGKYRVESSTFDRFLPLAEFFLVVNFLDENGANIGNTCDKMTFGFGRQDRFSKSLIYSGPIGKSSSREHVLRIPVTGELLPILKSAKSLLPVVLRNCPTTDARVKPAQPLQAEAKSTSGSNNTKEVRKSDISGDGKYAECILKAETFENVGKIDKLSEDIQWKVIPWFDKSRKCTISIKVLYENVWNTIDSDYVGPVGLGDEDICIRAIELGVRQFLCKGYLN